MLIPHKITLHLLTILAISVSAPRTLRAAPPAKEVNGQVTVEAEHFSAQDNTDVRRWYVHTKKKTTNIEPDGDPSHADTASGGAYLEILPDTRRTHDDKLTSGKNFMNSPGKMGVLSYKVNITHPGRYYVWVRAYSTSTEDNGLHVGLNGQWPESGQRLQWCNGKQAWRWESKQRTEKNHCGEPYKIYLDINKPGVHTIQFSMREDGFEFDQFLLTNNREFPHPDGPDANAPLAAKTAPPKGSPTKPVSSKPLMQPRQKNGPGTIQITGPLRTWHNITLTLDGPFAHEQDNTPNPFTDYRMTVHFTHSSGAQYTIPGYFAADGNAKNTSAQSGTKWRAHFSPDKQGDWTYRVSFHQGKLAALDESVAAKTLKPFHGKSGSINILPTNKSGRDLRAHGRLQYVGKHYLQFAGSKKYFLKAGADAPETLLAYADFDNTKGYKLQKAPIKTWAAHVQDWTPADPTWRNGKGKGLIGAINYLSSKGANAFSFLTYNAGGDGDNVWPFIQRDDKLHYDCSKLDQWATVFEHGTAKGMYLHFKMQETEMDDNRKGHNTPNSATIPESLDGGDLGPQRKLYCRELIARFGHNLALNWNLGEENTQTTAQQQAMINYIAKLDPYHHNIVVHTYPDQQDKIYTPLLGNRSKLTGVSLQNSSLETTHAQTVKWVQASTKANKPWIVAFDESGSASHAQPPDLGYNGFDGHDRTGKMTYTLHKVRKQTLWGTLMAGGAGCEYYFGYQFDQNDIVCEDWRSRDQSWDYCRIAINFFHDNNIPFWQMKNVDELVGNPKHEPTAFAFAKPNKLYLVYLTAGGQQKLDLTNAKGNFTLKWFNPRTGGPLQTGSIQQIRGGKTTSLGLPPNNPQEDWLAIIQR